MRQSWLGPAQQLHTRPHGKETNRMPLKSCRHIALLCVGMLTMFAPGALAQHDMHSTPPVNLAQASPPAQQAPTQTPPAQTATAMGDMHAPTSFTLRSGIAEGRMVYIGVGGEIDGKVNPLLMVHEGETIQINLINGEGA